MVLSLWFGFSSQPTRNHPQGGASSGEGDILLLPSECRDSQDSETAFCPSFDFKAADEDFYILQSPDVDSQPELSQDLKRKRLRSSEGHSDHDSDLEGSWKKQRPGSLEDSSCAEDEVTSFPATQVTAADLDATCQRSEGVSPLTAADLDAVCQRSEGASPLSAADPGAACPRSEGASLTAADLDAACQRLEGASPLIAADPDAARQGSTIASSGESTYHACHCQLEDEEVVLTNFFWLL